MDTLPEEMLQEIMEYLRYSDLKCFRLVCKRFYNASLTFRFVNRENFVYGDEIASPFCGYNFDNFMKILSTTERNFYHFHFFNTNITASFRDFVEKRAKYILSLRFDECGITYDPISFCESINECIKLKSLDMYEMFWPFFYDAGTISLPALETLIISFRPDDIFNISMDTNVTNLHLYVNLYHHIDLRLKDLKCVDLSYFCTDEQLMKIADSFNLTTIRVDCCDVTDLGIKYFVEKQRSLQIVALRSCASMTDESLFAIGEYLKDLKELIIGNCMTYHSFGAINRIIRFTPLRRLDCRVRIDFSGFATTVSDVTISKCLRQLRMYCMQNETFVTYIAENFLSLTELELKSSNGVTNETLRLICQNLKKLKKLILSDCNAINAFGDVVPQLTFSANFKNLEELNLSENEWLSDGTLETCFKLSSLRILKLAYCKGLTVKSFVIIAKNFPFLEDLHMTGLEVDNDILLSTVSSLKRLCKLWVQVSEPITNHLLNLLYEHSDSLHRVTFEAMACFIRSWEKKAFVKPTEWRELRWNVGK